MYTQIVNTTTSEDYIGNLVEFLFSGKWKYPGFTKTDPTPTTYTVNLTTQEKTTRGYQKNRVKPI